jgi:tRNA(fMet)-specific endonuclease VapC
VALRLLLDTNAYAALLRGHADVARRVRAASEVLLSAVVAGELMAGFRGGTRLDRNLRELETFLASPYVSLQPVTLTTADRFGRIAAGLRKKGTPLPTNDVWLAAHALETGAELLSFDDHFRHVEGIVWVRPGE